MKTLILAIITKYDCIIWTFIGVLDLMLFQEGSAPIDVVVTRSGGSLLRQFVQYTVVPNGAVEFYGYTNVLRFDPGVNRMSAALLPIADGVPEVSYHLFISEVYHNHIEPRSL